MKRILIGFSSLLFLCSLCFPTQSFTQRLRPEAQPEGKPSIDLPGKLPDGRILLPNGWKLSPVGMQLELGDLPLGMDVSPDGKYAVITNNGYSKPTISLVDVQTKKVIETIPLKNAWVGIKFSRDAKSFFVSGGNENVVYRYTVEQGKAALVQTFRFGQHYPMETISVAGLDIDQKDSLLYAVSKGDSGLRIVALVNSKKPPIKIPLPGIPYACRVSNDGKQVFISLWSSAHVLVYDIATSQVIQTIRVGDHPNEILQSSEGNRLFVANANANTVSVIDLSEGKVIETISTALLPNALAGSTPNSLALSNDERKLFVANADNNYLAVIDVSKFGRSKSLGFIPVGWYPTSVRICPKTNQILVANGKGLSSQANPDGPNPTMKKKPNEQYIASLFRGTLSIIDMPSTKQLAKYSEQVYGNSPYAEPKTKKKLCDKNNPIPYLSAKKSPVKYVFYIIKENRTYDQVFGDIVEGNGDSSLTLFPQAITPNHHALAKEFVLLDNFYADAEVSADGHNWSMAAYATDYVEKTWPTLYGERGGRYDFEEGEIASPSSGYVWDLCRKNNISYRSYGEFVQNGKTEKDSVKASVQALEGHVAPFFRGWDLNYSDIERAKAWMREFAEFERNGNLPRFQIIRLPNDHTWGTHLLALTPQAYVAQNDVALGMIVERISHSKFWKESAIFVIEDDAQNGPDHVDAHRTVALVASPYTKRHVVDHTMYSTSSMLQTMEIILGLPPMTQFDLAATPMCNSFISKPDFTPYISRKANVNLEEKNIAGVYGSKRSEELNLAEADAIPDIEFNEIIWKSIKGADSEMPPPTRSAFVRVIKSD